ncbi:MAG: TetR/AcrR family transcriptional regulator [Gordonia sp. (in: high G+C Gram-positive bacteria)]|uniref:TetR/AcrR family transcriptional regulator n=1 Tax=Gordonia sp. (in: high G+C Gram-positive bacteria) TaxID=84139 RepID=UPI0039E69CC6
MRAVPGVDAPRPVPDPIRAAVAATLMRLGRQRFTLSAVADDASVSRSTLYNWYGDKQTAVDDAFDYLAEQFVAMFAVAVQAETTLAGQLGRAAVSISEHRRWADPLSLHTTDLLDLILDERGDELMAQSTAFWSPLIAAAAQRGELPRTVDVDAAAEWIIRALLGIELLPPMHLDLTDPDAVSNYFSTHILGGIHGQT